MRMQVLRAGPCWLILLIGVQACAPNVYYPPRNRPPPVIEQSSNAPVVQPVPVPPPRETAIAQPLPAPQPHVQPPAVVALLDTAEHQANAGDLEAAGASLERAIRIDPRNAVLWYHLATVRLSQGDAQAAEQLAAKSNALAPGNNVQQSRNWLLIARARQAQGDARGAAAAEQRARDLAAR